MQSGQLISEIHHNSETNKIELDHYMDMLSDAVLIVKDNKIVHNNRVARHLFDYHGNEGLEKLSIFDLFADSSQLNKERYFLCLQEAEAIGKSSSHWEFKKAGWKHYTHRF